jgi:hypothetical protein
MRAMTVATLHAVERPAEAFEVRTITTADLRDALRQGWADFLAHRGDLLFVGIIYPLVGFAAAAIALQDSLVPLFFPLAAGVSLMGPAAAGGFYEMARRREQGLVSDWSHFLDVARRPSFDSFIAVAGLLLAMFLAWLAVAAALYLALMGTAPPASLGDFAARLFTTPEGWALIVLGNLAGLAFSGGADRKRGGDADADRQGCGCAHRDPYFAHGGGGQQGRDAALGLHRRGAAGAGVDPLVRRAGGGAAGARLCDLASLHQTGSTLTRTSVLPE